VRPSEFPYDDFLKVQQDKEASFLDFMAGDEWFIPVVQRPSSTLDHFGALCRDREKSLEFQLDLLARYLDLRSDFIYSYLEPWHGVGIYASAFGCPLYWDALSAPQTRTIYHTIEEVAGFRTPDITGCESMRMVMDTIGYFREVTRDKLDISLTDTQSVNDTASLIVDASEFLIMSITDPEALHPFLQAITDTIIRFTEMQVEAAGDRLSTPGHLMMSSPGLPGISISDDNMSILSPSAYENTAFPYNEQLARRFGGLAVHTCGDFVHNAARLLETNGLAAVDCAIGSVVDPTPNDPARLRDLFAGTGVILKVRLGAGQLTLLEPLIDENLKLIVEIRGEGSVEEKNRAYEVARRKIDEIMESRVSRAGRRHRQ
jgi:hypothetical protein